MKYRLIRSLLFSAAAALLLAACSLAADITPPPGYQAPTAAQAVSSGPAFPLVRPDPARAVEIYAEKCAPCHGDTGQGDGPQSGNLPNPAAPIGSADLARQSVPSDWYSVITSGRLDRFMPGFSGSLSDSQRWDVLSYVYSLSQTPALLAAGEEVYAVECASCHGENGDGKGPSASKLSSSPADFTAPQQAAALSQVEIKAVTESGSAPDMPAFSGKLSEDDLWAVSTYIQSLGLGYAPEQVSQVQVSSTPASQETSQPTAAAGGTAVAVTPQPDGTQAPGETANSQGSVTGQVINGSGGQVPAGIVVTLRGYDDMQEALTLETEADADGKYLFKDVEMPAGRVFMTTTEYNQSTFNSDVAHSVSGAEPLALDLLIYDTTNDISGLKVDRLHVLFDFTDPTSIQVVEMLIISNPTEKVVVAPNPGDPVVTYDLPEGATNLQFQDGELGGRYVETAQGFGDIQAISPGLAQHQVLFGYNIPYDKSLELSIPVPLPVEAGVVMVPEVGVTVTSDQLVDSGTRESEGLSLHVYSASSLAAGSSLDMSLKGRPGEGGSGSPSLSSSSGLIIGLAALGLLLVGLGAWVYLTKVRSPRKLAPVADVVETYPVLQEDADGLVDAIIALDDQYRSGGISEQAYRQRRAELKERLAGAINSKPQAG